MPISIHYQQATGLTFVVNNTIGVEFIDSTDGVSIGIGIKGLTVPTTFTKYGLFEPIHENIDYCNYTITPTDMDSCVANNTYHFYPVIFDKNYIVACNDASKLDEPLDMKTPMSHGPSYEGRGFLIYRNVRKCGNIYYLELIASME